MGDIVEPVKEDDGPRQGGGGLRRGGGGSNNDLFGSSNSLTELATSAAADQVEEILKMSTSAGPPGPARGGAASSDKNLDDREKSMLTAAWHVITDEAHPDKVSAGETPPEFSPLPCPFRRRLARPVSPRRRIPICPETIARGSFGVSLKNNKFAQMELPDGSSDVDMQKAWIACFDARKQSVGLVGLGQGWVQQGGRAAILPHRKPCSHSGGASPSICYPHRLGVAKRHRRLGVQVGPAARADDRPAASQEDRRPDAEDL